MYSHAVSVSNHEDDKPRIDLSDIFQEVEEDVRRERYEQLWKDYGNYIMVAAAVLVLAVAGYQAWRSYDLSQRQKTSDQYRVASQSAQTGNAPKAEADFSALVKSAPSGYATLAKFHLAGAYLAQGKRDPAVALLRELSTSSDPIVSSTARLKLAWMMADANPKAEVVSVLQPLIAADSPWRFAASEMVAYIDLKDGARTQAMAEYQKLSQETDAPANLRQRASGIAEYLKANPDAVISTAPPPTLSLTPPSLPSLSAPPAPSASAPPQLPKGQTQNEVAYRVESHSLVCCRQRACRLRHLQHRRRLVRQGQEKQDSGRAHLHHRIRSSSSPPIRCWRPPKWICRRRKRMWTGRSPAARRTMSRAI